VEIFLALECCTIYAEEVRMTTAKNLSWEEKEDADYSSEECREVVQWHNMTKLPNTQEVQWALLICKFTFCYSNRSSINPAHKKSIEPEEENECKVEAMIPSSDSLVCKPRVLIISINTFINNRTMHGCLSSDCLTLCTYLHLWNRL
jgi:hypothetical protein